jgi:AraC-like DNA-binding protein
MAREYLAQVETLAIIVFLSWRVETLQQLDDKLSYTSQEDEMAPLSLPITINIHQQLKTHCEARQSYLQHDITLQQLATAIGTNRTYLGNYFAQQGTTYNTYINRLRIDHFMRCYQKSIRSNLPFTATELAQQSGFRSYSTFAAAFKQFNGQTVASWMKSL